jgi:hypothetical protein
MGILTGEYMKGVNIIPLICTIVLCATLVLFGWYIYPTKFHYMTVSQSNIAIKIDRITGEVWKISASNTRGWIKIDEQE